MPPLCVWTRGCTSASFVGAFMDGLEVDDKARIPANGGGENWQLAADARGTFPLDHDHNKAGASGGRGNAFMVPLPAPCSVPLTPRPLRNPPLSGLASFKM